MTTLLTLLVFAGLALIIWVFVAAMRELLTTPAFLCLIGGLFAFGGFLYLVGVPLSVPGY